MIPERSEEFTLGYLFGLVDGEGCFTITHESHPTHPNWKVIGIPHLVVSNTDASILFYLKEYLEQHGIRTHIYSQRKRPDWKQIYRLTVSGFQQCPKLFRVFDGQIISDEKRLQYEKWKTYIINTLKYRRTKHEQVINRNTIITQRVKMGESPLVVAKELGFARSTLYVMLQRNGTNVGKLRGEVHG